MPTLRIHKRLHDALADWNLKTCGRGQDTSQTTFHSDGTVEFYVGQDVLDRLSELSDDPEIAIAKALELKLD
jgi:hypothetical protein